MTARGSPGRSALPAARPGLRTLLALCRVSNLPTVWMNVLCALVLSGAAFGAGSFAQLALALSAFYCAGMALNDLCDREHDARLQPFRPIPAGRIGVGAAQLVTALLFALGLALLAAAPQPRALLAGLSLAALIALYDVTHKHHAASVLLMAGCRALVYGVAAEAVAARVAPAVATAAAVQFGYTLLISAVSRHEQARGARFSFPVIPRMIAAMPLVDGLVLAVAASPVWLLPAAAAALLTHFGQRYVRGD